MSDELVERVALRFWPKVAKSEPHLCWEWQASKGQRGYGSFSVNGRPHRAHRVAYQLAYGQIPAGMFVCHRCDNPSCCNPAHLFIGTCADNNRDKTSKGRNVRPMRDETTVSRARGSKSNFAKLTEQDVGAIRARSAAGEKTVSLAREYGVDRTLIWQIVTKRAWAHV